MRFLYGFLVINNLDYASKTWCFCHFQMVTDKPPGAFWHKESLSKKLTGQYVNKRWSKNTWQ
ncbi:hypothetical protein CRH02_23910 [Escherichia albertii]|nr:hypothetical protein [Escherichia albertii]PFF93608.1 hypothetical protein CRH02_23910 [Escherichia albertii]